MSRKLIKKRGPVEIYFILYLAALVMILPDIKDNVEGKDNLFDEGSVTFHLNPVKPSLTCRLFIDSTGVRISEFDAENTIHYSGNVKNVQMEFTITDEETSNSVMLETDKDYETSDFNLYHNPENNLVKFYWKPPIYERRNKNYIVKITAKANPVDFTDSITAITPTSEQPMIIKRSQFRLAVYVNRAGTVVYVPGGDDLAKGTGGRDSIRQSPSLEREFLIGDMSLYPVYSPLRVIANQQWENRIIVIGLNPQRDLSELPEITVTGGEAYISGISPNEIKLSGTTPSSGRMNVKIKLKRKYDMKEVSADFSVVPEPLFKPEYDAEMYPGNPYTIDPKLPALIGQDVKAVIMLDNRTLVTSRHGSKFEFSPDISDTGKIVSLERFVNNKRIGQTYPIKILPFPAPSIININEKSAKIITIETICYGIVRGEKNIISDIEIIGNAKWQEYFPNIISEAAKSSYKQFFMLTPLKDDQPFRFRVRAVDKRGKKSDFFVYE